jgi:hypothetical protein
LLLAARDKARAILCNIRERNWMVSGRSLDAAATIVTNRRGLPESFLPAGWAGPAVLPQGFVHNRTFGAMPPNQIVRHIREMVFSARI